jgi:hypothetical protein
VSPAPLTFDELTLPPPAARRLVVVPIGRFDLRTIRTVEYAWRIRTHERRALHVVTSESRLWALADSWMGQRESFPLHVVENDGGVAASVANLVRLELAAGFGEVVVLTGRIARRRRVERLVHHRTADAIATALLGVGGALTAVVTVGAR